MTPFGLQIISFVGWVGGKFESLRKLRAEGLLCVFCSVSFRVPRFLFWVALVLLKSSMIR